MAHLVHDLSEWLATTRLSMVIQEVTWIIPLVQTLHILSIAIVISSIFMIDLRLVGIGARSQPTAAVVNRFLPWVWYALIVLLFSGSLLIIGEPARSLENPAFRLKMLMLVTVIVLTVLLQRPLRRNPQFWELNSLRKAASMGIAVASLALWTAVLFAGRWIAYTSE